MRVRLSSRGANCLEGARSHLLDRETTNQDDSQGDFRWPVGTIIGLVIVVLVNLVFIFIAVSDADDVVSSYSTEER